MTKFTSTFQRCQCKHSAPAHSVEVVVSEVHSETVAKSTGAHWKEIMLKAKVTVNLESFFWWKKKKKKKEREKK